MARYYWILSQSHAWSTGKAGASPCPEAEKNLLRSQTTPLRIHSPGSLTLFSHISLLCRFFSSASSCHPDEPLLQWNLDRDTAVEEKLERDVARSNRVA